MSGSQSSLLSNQQIGVAVALAALGGAIAYTLLSAEPAKKPKKSTGSTASLKRASKKFEKLRRVTAAPKASLAAPAGKKKKTDAALAQKLTADVKRYLRAN